MTNTIHKPVARLKKEKRHRLSMSWREEEISLQILQPLEKSQNHRSRNRLKTEHYEQLHTHESDNLIRKTPGENSLKMKLTTRTVLSNQRYTICNLKISKIEIHRPIWFQRRILWTSQRMSTNSTQPLEHRTKRQRFSTKVRAGLRSGAKTSTKRTAAPAPSTLGNTERPSGQ